MKLFSIVVIVWCLTPFILLGFVIGAIYGSIQFGMRGWNKLCSWLGIE